MLTILLRDLEARRQVGIEVVLSVEGTSRIDVGLEGEASEEGEPDGLCLQDLSVRVD